MLHVLVVNSRLQVPVSEFEFSYARSSGPGGQNVNKVSSKALLRWPVAASSALPADVRARFLKRFARRLTGEGEVLISSQRFRDQSRNASDCLEKLRAMLADVATPPTVRKRTRPTRASGERRLKRKRVAGRKKELRRPPADE
jgi:ribosome-associated protein